MACLCDTNKYQDGCSSHTVGDIRWCNWHVYKSFHDTHSCIYIPLAFGKIHFSSDIQGEVCILCNFLQSIQGDNFDQIKILVIN